MAKKKAIGPRNRVAKGHSSLRLNFQMWVCPTDTVFIRCTELNEVPNTNLQPLVLFASEELDGEQRWFRGPKTPKVGASTQRFAGFVAGGLCVVIFGADAAFKASSSRSTFCHSVGFFLVAYGFPRSA